MKQQLALESTYWSAQETHEIRWQSLSCPFSITATEGPIGVLKAIEGVQFTPYTECLLRALLVARKYNVPDQVLEERLPMVQHFIATRAMARQLLMRDAPSVRQAERGAAHLEYLQQAQRASDEQSQKRSRIDEAEHTKLTDPHAIEQLALTRGSGHALNNQAELWNVPKGRNKGETAQRIVGEIRKHQPGSPVHGEVGSSAHGEECEDGEDNVWV